MGTSKVADGTRDGSKELTSIFRRSMFWVPERQASSAWVEHLPFAFWLIDVLRPTTIVELGTHNGVSYSAMCQAVKTLGLATRCYAVDTWKGDQHAGFYPEQVYRDLKAFHDQRYTAFSRLVRSTFDEALRHFEDASIDVLHIDGLHTYEAVRHDFESWLPKLSPNAVVLMHDTNVRENNFGVFRLWNEVGVGRLHFHFLHGHGLGVLGMGRSYPGDLRLLFGPTEDEDRVSFLREVFAYLGQSIRLLWEFAELERAVAEEKARIAKLERASAEKGARIAELERASVESEARITELNHTLSRSRTELQGQISALHASTSWRATAPLREARRLARRLTFGPLRYIATLYSRVFGCAQLSRQGIKAGRNKMSLVGSTLDPRRDQR